MTNYKLPPRKWYTLEQATKRIQQLTGENIQIEDLLHYWQVGQLLIYTNVKYTSKDHILTIGNMDLMYDSPIIFQFNSTEEEKNFIDIEDDYCNVRFNVEEQNINEEDDDIEDPFLFSIIDKYDRLEGFFSVMSGFTDKRKGSIEVNKIIENGLSLNDFNEFMKPPVKFTEEKSLLFLITPSVINIGKNHSIPIDQLYILENDLIPFFNGEIEKYLRILSDTYREEQEKTEIKTFSKTVQENQINFIRALLYMDYGIETPQEAKNALNTGELGRKIEKFKRENPNIETDKNFKFPSYVTLSNWYSKA